MRTLPSVKKTTYQISMDRPNKNKLANRIRMRVTANNSLTLASHGHFLAASAFPLFDTAARPETTRDTDDPIVM